MGASDYDVGVFLMQDTEEGDRVIPNAGRLW